MEKMSFERTIKFVDVDVVDVDGKIEACKLVEMKGSERDQFQILTSGNWKYDESGKAVEMVKPGAEAALLSLTFYHESGDKWTAEEIETLPSTMIDQLSEAAMEICALGRHGAKEAKNV